MTGGVESTVEDAGSALGETEPAGAGAGSSGAEGETVATESAPATGSPELAGGDAASGIADLGSTAGAVESTLGGLVDQVESTVVPAAGGDAPATGEPSEPTLDPLSSLPSLGGDSGAGPAPTDTPSETLDQPSSLPLLETATEVVAPLTPAVEEVTGTVSEPAAPITETVTEPVTRIVETVTAPLAPLVETVTAPVAPVVETVTAPLVPIVQTVTAPLVPVVETVTRPLAPIVETVTAPLLPIVETVTRPLAPVVETVTAPLRPIVETVTAPLAPVVGTVTQPLAPVTDTVAGTARVVPPLGGSSGDDTGAPPPSAPAVGTPAPYDLLKGAGLRGSSPLADGGLAGPGSGLRDSLGGARPPADRADLGISDLLADSLANPFGVQQPSVAGAPDWKSPAIEAPAEPGSGPGGLPGAPELPAPLGGASSAGGGSGFGFSIFLALLVSLAAFAVQFYSRLQVPPARWRPTAFVAVIERPG